MIERLRDKKDVSADEILPERAAFSSAFPLRPGQHHAAGARSLAGERLQEGLALINAVNITASVFINGDEGGLHQDYEAWLEDLAPEKPCSRYRHNGFEDNADARLTRTVMGRKTAAAVTDGKLDFGA